MRHLRFILIASLAALLAGCAVGPDFEPPAAPDTTSYDDEAAMQTVTANDPQGIAQSMSPGALLPREWWTLFHSAPLDAMITEALLHNPDLKAAEANLRAADEFLAAGEAVLFPQIDGNFSSQRVKTSAASNGGFFPGTIYTLHNASVSVSYTFDLFGGNRRQIEEFEAQRDYQRFELEGVRLSLTANLATTAIQEASLRGQIEATKTLIDEQQKQLDLAKRQLDFGGVTRLAVLSQETTVAQSRASLPPLEQQLAETRHALSVLMGHMPLQVPEGQFELATLHLPYDVPLTLPSELVEQRPDIRAAEANLHIASAAIGVAEANRLPQITLSADIGSVANQVGKLFTPGNGIWDWGGSVTQVLFDAGALAHEQGAAEAQYDAAAAMYKKAVLLAFKDVADTLRALDADAKTLKAQSEAEHAASESLKLAHDQFDAGAISYLGLLDAENAEQRSRILLVQAEAQRFADTAALFQALGGGWNTPEIAGTPNTSVTPSAPPEESTP